MSDLDTKTLTRDQLEELLEQTEQLKKAKQKHAIDGYNNPDVIGESKVHRIQVQFHKDQSKTRLFLGGNRCLLADTKIIGPNYRQIKIADLKEGDTVLAVDPETRLTAPVPVEKLYNNGTQWVHSFTRTGNSGYASDSITCTPNHLILTPESGLRPAGSLEEHAETAKADSIAFVGRKEPYAGAIGFLLSTLVFDNKRPYVAAGKNVYYAVKSLVAHGLSGYIKTSETRTNKHMVYGGLARFCTEHCQDKARFMSQVMFEWDTDSVLKFLKGFLNDKMLYHRGCWHIVSRQVTDIQAIAHLLTAAGVFTKPLNYSKSLYGYPIILDSPHDVLRITERVAPPRYRDRMRDWALPRIQYCKQEDSLLLKQENYWRQRRNTGNNYPADVFDIKLAGGHNLFLADNFVVSNSGKTEAGAVESYWYLSGTHPYKHVAVPNNGRIIVESLELLEQDIIPKFKKWAPNYESWEPIKGHQGKIAGWRLPNGSRVDVFTFNQESTKLEGTSIRWCWINEPPPQQHVIASMRGLVDQDGDLWFTLTPLSEPYLYNDFYLPATSGTRSDISVYTASIHDNPWLQESAKKRFLSSLDPEEREAREKGVFKHLTGRVFKDFETKTHVIPTADWPREWPVTIGIDPHLRKEHVAVFLGKTRKGWYVALDEVSCGGDLEEFGNSIVEKVIERGFDVQTICADTFLEQPDIIRRDIEPRAVLDNIFRVAGLPSIKLADKKNTKSAFISEMRRLLKIIEWPQLDRTKEGLIYKAPSFFAMDCCIGLIKDFMNYVYKTSRRPEISGDSEDPIKKWDDFLDAAKYAMIADPYFKSNMMARATRVFETYTGKR